MNETRRKPTTGRQSPSLCDKWHGIFYMPSRIDEAGHTKAFGYPVAEHWGESQNGHVPPFSFPNYSFLNNFVIFTTLVHLREALSYYVGLPLKLSFRSLQVYTTVFYPVFSNANNHELFSCGPHPPPPPFSEILDLPVLGLCYITLTPQD